MVISKVGVAQYYGPSGPVLTSLAPVQRVLFEHIKQTKAKRVYLVSVVPRRTATLAQALTTGRILYQPVGLLMLAACSTAKCVHRVGGIIDWPLDIEASC